MTDSEIKKALNEILKIMCVMGDLQKASTISKTLDLINRLQATVDDLNVRLTEERHRTDYIGKSYNEIKAEAYKECIEKVKEEIKQALESNYKARAEREKKEPKYFEGIFWNYCTGKIQCLQGLDDFLDNLLKELVGDKP